MKRAARTQHHCLTVTHLGQLVDTTLVERRSRAPQGSRAQGSSAPGRQGSRSETHLGASVTSTQTNDSDMAGPPTRVSWEVTCPRPARVLPPIHTSVGPRRNIARAPLQHPSPWRSAANGRPASPDPPASAHAGVGWAFAGLPKKSQLQACSALASAAPVGGFWQQSQRVDRWPGVADLSPEAAKKHCRLTFFFDPCSSCQSRVALQATPVLCCNSQPYVHTAVAPAPLQVSRYAYRFRLSRRANSPRGRWRCHFVRRATEPLPRPTLQTSQSRR